jgi:hypothetical protein
MSIQPQAPAASHATVRKLRTIYVETLTGFCGCQSYVGEICLLNACQFIPFGTPGRHATRKIDIASSRLCIIGGLHIGQLMAMFIAYWPC